MAKWYGVIGYVETVQNVPGVWDPVITERNYTGELTRIHSRFSNNVSSTNDDININNQLSILADPFAYQHFESMKYVKFHGTKWKITSVEVQYPRLILSIGCIYNG